LGWGNSMNFDEYQKKAAGFIQTECRNKEYLTLGLAGETGEVCEKILALRLSISTAKVCEKTKRLIRGDGAIDDDLLYELGDTLWYVSQLAEFFCVNLSKIAQMNLDKLEKRKAKNTIKGSGDKR